MDIRHVDCPGTLRCWRSLGLHHILLPAGRAPAGQAAAPPSTAAVSPTPSQDVIRRARERLDPPHAQVWTYWELPMDLSESPSP
ncbi:MAG: hypothetical protein ACOC15_02660, partial [Desulfovibrionales bacterium]